ncbi:hypothetical protein FYK55_21320 [Roseiconus nitratireducens]|uniref:Uncharacterized protein n=1 Tax=Roseiconus nitratireducens TaxID=2605748 RepID=A0A5M6CYK0_9BACT|nr:hypothetical protein [Roseiconus nitratireducens]KAA5540183.1 hypothetical protein FYK55_21320 [Roseiconus nitratireducens]
MIYFIPWALLMLAVILAVPIAAKMSPKPAGAKRAAEEPDGEEVFEEGVPGEDDFASAEDDFGAEPLGDDDFADFK